MNAGVSLILDRTLKVPPGQVVKTGYVDASKVDLVCREPMALGDVALKYELVKQNAPNAVYPAPLGTWAGERFLLVDGRHLYIAYLMHGYRSILVSWIDEP